MILIEVSLFSARTKKKTHLGTAVIANDGTGNLKRGNYKFRISRRDNSRKIWREGVLEDFPRLSYNVWHLIYRILKVALNAKN